MNGEMKSTYFRLSMLGKNLADNILKYFLIFPRRSDLMCLKCQILLSAKKKKKKIIITVIIIIQPYCHYLLELRFSSPVNPLRSCKAYSVNLFTLFLDRLSPLRVNQGPVSKHC